MAATQLLGWQAHPVGMSTPTYRQLVGHGEPNGNPHVAPRPDTPAAAAASAAFRLRGRLWRLRAAAGEPRGALGHAEDADGEEEGGRHRAQQEEQPPRGNEPAGRLGQEDADRDRRSERRLHGRCVLGGDGLAHVERLREGAKADAEADLPPGFSCALLRLAELWTWCVGSSVARRRSFGDAGFERQLAIRALEKRSSMEWRPRKHSQSRQ